MRHIIISLIVIHFSISALTESAKDNKEKKHNYTDNPCTHLMEQIKVRFPEDNILSICDLHWKPNSQPIVTYTKQPVLQMHHKEFPLYLDSKNKPVISFVPKKDPVHYMLRRALKDKPAMMLVEKRGDNIIGLLDYPALYDYRTGEINFDAIWSGDLNADNKADLFYLQKNMNYSSLVISDSKKDFIQIPPLLRKTKKNSTKI